jgi:hypothetical protein
VLRCRRHYTTELRRPFVKAGADILTVASAIWWHPIGPRAAVREFNGVFGRYGRAFIGERS